MTSVAEIDSRIYELRREIHDLRQTRAVQLARERASEKQWEVIRYTLMGFEDGLQVTVWRGRGWWHYKGELVRRALPDELQAAEHLARAGAVERESV